LSLTERESQRRVTGKSRSGVERLGRVSSPRGTRWVIAFAKKRGLKTINVVRRPELIEELKKLGADVVVVDSQGLAKDFEREIRGARITGSATPSSPRRSRRRCAKRHG
jgi:hypothetical protein